MTIRKYLSKKRAKFFFFTIIPASIMMLFMNYFFNSVWLYLISFCVVCFIDFYILNNYVKCPNCGKKIGRLLYKGRNVLEISPEVKQCPKCQISFDKELDESMRFRF